MIEELEKQAKSHLRGFNKNYSKAAYLYKRITDSFLLEQKYEGSFDYLQISINLYNKALSDEDKYNLLINQQENIKSFLSLIPHYKLVSHESLETIIMVIKEINDSIKYLTLSKFDLNASELLLFHYSMYIIENALFFTNKKNIDEINSLLAISSREILSVFETHYMKEHSIEIREIPLFSYSYQDMKNKFNDIAKFQQNSSLNEVIYGIICDLMILKNLLQQANLDTLKLIQKALFSDINIDLSIIFETFRNEQDVYHLINTSKDLADLENYESLISKMESFNLNFFHERLVKNYPLIKKKLLSSFLTQFHAIPLEDLALYLKVDENSLSSLFASQDISYNFSSEGSSIIPSFEIPETSIHKIMENQKLQYFFYFRADQDILEPARSEFKYCSYCGNKLNSDEKKCRLCGNEV